GAGAWPTPRAPPRFPPAHQRRGGAACAGGPGGRRLGARGGAHRRLWHRGGRGGGGGGGRRGGARPGLRAGGAARRAGRGAGGGGPRTDHPPRAGALRLRRRAAGGPVSLSGPEERPFVAPFRVWVVDAREETRAWLGRSLAEAGHSVEWAGTPAE